jgi:hypothetical protein
MKGGSWGDLQGWGAAKSTKSWQGHWTGEDGRARRMASPVWEGSCPAISVAPVGSPQALSPIPNRSRQAGRSRQRSKSLGRELRKAGEGEGGSRTPRT